MERAGAAAARIRRAVCPRPGGPVIVSCGHGNNGGDGWVLARLLRRARLGVEIWLVGRPDVVRGDAAVMLGRWRGSVSTVASPRAARFAARAVPPRGRGRRCAVRHGARRASHGTLAAVVDAINGAARPCWPSTSRRVCPRTRGGLSASRCGPPSPRPSLSRGRAGRGPRAVVDALLRMASVAARARRRRAQRGRRYTCWSASGADRGHAAPRGDGPPGGTDTRDVQADRRAARRIRGAARVTVLKGAGRSSRARTGAAICRPAIRAWPPAGWETCSRAWSAAPRAGPRARGRRVGVFVHGAAADTVAGRRGRSGCWRGTCRTSSRRPSRPPGGRAQEAVQGRDLATRAGGPSARREPRPAAHGGELLGLVGELGAGKTRPARGLAAGLGVDPDAVHSPTFAIVTDYGAAASRSARGPVPP